MTDRVDNSSSVAVMVAVVAVIAIAAIAYFFWATGTWAAR